jgi:hypothetical protein
MFHTLVQTFFDICSADLIRNSMLHAIGAAAQQRRATGSDAKRPMNESKTDSLNIEGC